MTVAHNVVVTFAADPVVTASVSGGHGSVDPASQVIDCNGTATIDITTDANYHIASITDNGTPVAIANPYVISNVTADHNVVVAKLSTPIP